MSTTSRFLRPFALLCATYGALLLGCSPETPETAEVTAEAPVVAPGDADQAPAQESTPAAPGRLQIGETVAADIRSPEYLPGVGESGTQLVWERELTHPGATYIAPHFSYFSLPEGAHLIVRTPDDTRSRKYVGTGKPLPPGVTEFWGQHMPGERAILRLYSDTAIPEGAVALDSFARGLDKYNYINDPTGEKAICGSDDSLEAKCYQSSEPAAYDKARAVARLFINGTGFCTGWLVGSQGHVMTNQHCIGNATEALNTDFEFMAEGADCSTDCMAQTACGGDVAADTSELVRVNASLDYSLVLLPDNASNDYGFMQLREEPAELGERIFIAQHPAGWGKRIAMLDGNDDAIITSLDAPACTGGAPVPDIGYFADTQGGSSGSPVLGYSDHFVVALHHCANCPNRGVPITAIINDLGNDVPPDGIGVLCSPQPIADVGPDKSVCQGDSVTIGTPKLAGYTYSWQPGGQSSAQITVSPSSNTTYTRTATNPCSSAEDSVTVTVVTSPTGQCAPDQADGNSCLGNSACASGFCVDGVCCAQACTGTCEACSVAAGSGADGSCQTRAAGAVCRPESGGCDVAETCDGVANTCPADVIETAGSTCRAAVGGCDVAETCDGISAACAIDSLRATGDVCRTSVGGCDPAETCTGVNPMCPDDSLLSSGEACRPRAGQCDVTEVCDGVTAVCPPDVLASDGQLCRSAFGGCDVPEFCDGLTVDCPANEALAAGEVCREAVGGCDVQEVCDGVATVCPPNNVLEEGVVCRSTVGGCDAEEMCNGISPSCPDDVVKEAGEVCRDLAGNCDFIETCDGESFACPDDEVVAAGEPCRDVAGECDLAEACDGLNGACPDDSFMAAGDVCRTGAGSCDPDETCTGSSAACPDDGLIADGSSCLVGECVNEGTCLSGVCQLEGECELPSEPGGCNCSSADPAAGFSTGLLLVLALFFGTRRRRRDALV